MDPVQAKPLGRDRHLDGLRGVAALGVVIEHFSALLPFHPVDHYNSIAQELIGNALHFPFQAGNFAVYIFFAISGVVVANAAIGKPVSLALPARYLRLTVPMVFAALLAWVSLSIFPGELPKIASFLPNHWTTTIYQGPVPTLWKAVSEAAYGAYLFGNPDVNPVLWSMQVELWGSFGIFICYGTFGLRGRTMAMIVIAFALLVYGWWQYLPFPVGALLFELNVRDVFRWRRGIGMLVVLIGVAFGVVATLSAWRYYSELLQTFFRPKIELKALISSAGGLMIVGGILASETGKAVLTTNVSLFLGRVSYCLYLTHMPLLYGAFAALYLALGTPPQVSVVAGWGLGFFAVAFLLAWAMTVGLDEPVTRRLKVYRRRG